MNRPFEYRPKFYDIRVRPPKEGEEDPAHDVLGLKPGEKRCDHPDCRLAGSAKAPKSRDMPGDHYWFCQRHAAEYNKNWNFYAGMSEAQIRAEQESERMTGGRPTWSFKADANSREAAAMAARDARHFADPFGVFRAQQRRAEAERSAAERRLGKLERQALADLDLEATADSAAIRARYKELLKRCHPDANGGDRSAEHKLQRVIKAYKQLQKSGMV
ncbi:molecular chaperone DnaJ [Caulobacter vibrioides]|uniref:DnaJ-related protein n=2 Tax=Caulobacter vibrioides TaxID=155892 RepID=Q9A433_CAUVC|nr:J domain-containing protein [Caulobacter vibrioides]YP_002518478.1 DnaJ domain protein [Caulobacter vibrioides NA1000]AAK24972.1 DnaJ-related protein [Caulobacter vibrioides CB15]ACL96570.1 DnaJ domain protein [Caulobacter vibrioides NA1000]ATC25901.1 molecular chaperone DnaJ [Caulobacter vibrioides]ATC29844.1 molecular chaperone DnaJ [Caulobacter vibrioides]AZH14047.1 molecular chaperone DnaJ [Caulobacter vibrioides]